MHSNHAPFEHLTKPRYSWHDVIRNLKYDSLHIEHPLNDNLRRIIMKKQIICLACTVIALMGTPLYVYASDEGALIGGLTGGIICSNVGQGVGRSVAIGYCASIGAVLGDRMSNRQFGQYGIGQPTYYYPYSYSYSYQQPSYSMYGMDVEAAKARGKADRMREEQRRAIDRAYWCGYHGTCE